MQYFENDKMVMQCLILSRYITLFENIKGNQVLCMLFELRKLH